MSNGICWLASAGMRSYSSSSLIGGSGTLLTITEWPETEVATFFVFTPAESKIRLMALATCGASMMAPSTTVSGASDSMPKLTSSSPALVDFNSTDLIELEPMSSPTSCLLFFPPNNISQPLYSFALPKLCRLRFRLTPPRVHLAHFAFHPSIQNGLTQFPPITEFEGSNFALRELP